LGVLLNSAGDPYQIGILSGLIEGASMAGANLLCFMGGQLPGADGGADVRHRIYELCGPQNVDGIALLSSTFAHHVGPSGLRRYSERYGSLPLCSVGLELEGMPSVLPDNEGGMRRAVEHLIREHGLRRIAFVRGPLANTEAEGRFNAYRSVLAEQSIPFDERLVLTGNFLAESGREAVEQWVRVLGPELAEIEAIVASNDAMALGVLGALDQLGLAVPQRIALIGFDDVEECRLAQPPLTTVRQPLEKAGRAAHRILLEWLQHGQRPAPELLNTELVARRSCGCAALPPLASPPPATERNYTFELALAGRRPQIVDALTRAARGTFGAAGPNWQDRLLNALASDLREDEATLFLRLIQDIQDRLVARGTNPDVCDQVLRALRQGVVSLMRADHTKRERAEDLFHLAHQTMSSTIQRGLARENLKLARGARAMSSVCNALVSTFDFAALHTSILQQLPSLGMQSCFVILYENQAGRQRGRVLVAYDAGKELHAPADLRFDPGALLPPEWVHAEKAGRSFVVMPLVHKHESLGHILLELKLEHAFSYGTIADAVSTAVRGAMLGARPA
jgi:phosphoserine phosphatase RsbU/P